MHQNPRKFRREPAEKRREELIFAALEMIADKGVHGASIRNIAERAGVTPGLIRHYFHSKEELVAAAYEHHMTVLTGKVVECADGETAIEQLKNFITASLKPPVVSPEELALWAGFLNTVQKNEAMRLIHERTYFGFRQHLEKLTGAALAETGRPARPGQLRKLAIALNAVMDGLWLEGGALPDEFAAGELVTIGLEAASAITGISMGTEAETT